MWLSPKIYLLLGAAFLTCASAATTTRTQVSGRTVGASTVKPGAAATTVKPINVTQIGTGRSLMSPYNLLGNGENSTGQEHYFSEIELERLCPPGNTEILKSIPKETTGCKTGNLDFYYQRCRCHYVKWLTCPPCPEAPETQVAGRSIQTSNDQNGPEQSGPHFVLGLPNPNNTVVYQIPMGSSDHNGNDSTADFATANKFSVYNSAGGIVNLYFYQTGQQQLINNGLDASNRTSNGSATTGSQKRDKRG